MLAKLWNDEAGSVALEYLMLLTIVGLALAVGFSSVAGALNSEYVELSQAITGLNQSYSYVAASGCQGSHGGTTAIDPIAGPSLYNETATVPGTVVTATVNVVACP